MHQQQLTPANVLLQTRIIVGALIAGATMFAAVALYIHFTSGPFVTDDPMLVYALTGAAALIMLVTAAISFVAPRGIIKRGGESAAQAATPEEGENAIATHYSQICVIRGALAEGPALFCIVIFLLAGFWPILLGLLLELAHFAILFPTKDRYDTFTQHALGMK